LFSAVQTGNLARALGAGFLILFLYGFFTHWHREWFPDWLPYLKPKGDAISQSIKDNLSHQGFDFKSWPSSRSIPQAPNLLGSPTPFEAYPSPTPAQTEIPWTEVPHVLHPLEYGSDILVDYIKGGESDFHVIDAVLFIGGAIVGYNIGAVFGDFERIREGRGP
jgi:hypothetical protein